MRFRLYWSYATRSLLRGGQRTVLAIFCVAVGVMAIIALQLVGLSVNQALTTNIVEANGGDLSLRVLPTAPLRQSELAAFDRLKQQGQISDYATSVELDSVITLPSGGIETLSLLAVSSNFPLAGQVNFLAPAHNLNLQNMLTGKNAAMNSEIFNDLDAQIGSAYQVRTEDGRIIPITVAAEFQNGGPLIGREVVISEAALSAIPGPNGTPLPPEFSTVYMTVPAANLNQVERQLSRQFPESRVISAQDLLNQRQQQVDQIRLFLRLVGLLALFIGGIGIINTMQVLLRRRRLEIAMLKTTGYRRTDLYALFGLEAALLGLSGGIIGTAAGVGASYLVRLVVERAFFLDLPIILDPLTIFSGLLIGLVTALIFGLLPIVQASQIRPLAVLREAEERAGAASRLTTAGLLLILSLLFVVLSAIILHNLVMALVAVYGGAGVVFALAFGFSLMVLAISRLPVYERPRPRILLWILAALGIAILAGLAFGLLALLGGLVTGATHGSLVGIYIFVLLGGLGIVLVGGALVFLLANIINGVVMFAPRSWKTPVMLAYRNIGRQRWPTTTMLTALFAGVFGIGLVLTLGQGIENAINTTLENSLTYNVFIIAPTGEKATIQSELSGQQGIDASKTIATIVTQVRPVSIAGKNVSSIIKYLVEQDDSAALSGLEGFNLSAGGNNVPDIQVKDGRNLDSRDAGSNHIVVDAFLEQDPIDLRVNDTIVLESQDGKVRKTLQIVGFYDSSSPTGNPNFGSILADQGVTAQLGGVFTVEVFSLKVDPNQIAALRKHLSQAAPSALVFSFVDLGALITQVLNNIIIMLTTIASLAMIAGLIIIANAVALAMLERRREIGILKSVGHTSRSVLATVLVENGLVGLLGSLVAMLLVAGAITALSQFVLQIAISVGAGLVALTIGSTVLVTILMAAGVAWGAVRVRPLEVLRYE